MNFWLNFDNFYILELKITKIQNFCENRPTNMLYASNETLNHLKIDFIAKEYDLCENKTEKIRIFRFLTKKMRWIS